MGQQKKSIDLKVGNFVRSSLNFNPVENYPETIKLSVIYKPIFSKNQSICTNHDLYGTLNLRQKYNLGKVQCKCLRLCPKLDIKVLES